ncbi:guanine nucleotide binding protein, alpha subunit [Chiua virens]|nr:guanine nucleotide binding protein, alpha subunit [Chiua virens]
MHIHNILGSEVTEPDSEIGIVEPFLLPNIKPFCFCPPSFFDSLARLHMPLDYDPTDPLAIVTAPPPNETRKEKAAREKREAEAQRISDQIDGKLCAEKVTLQKQDQAVKILLIGQSGDSGNIALLRHFLLRFARVQWAQELASWKIILRLKLVHSVNMILDALQAASQDEVVDALPVTDQHQHRHDRLRLRLRPLRGVECYLKRLLDMKAEDTIQHSATKLFKPSPNAALEFCDKFRDWHSGLQNRGTGHVDGLSGQDVTEVLWNCKNHIQALWTDPVVREMVQRSRIRMDDYTSFCLDNSERLTARNYEPTDDDILYARLCIPGVREHEFELTEYERPQKWKIYDVVSSRTQRRAWIPYIDRVDSIVILAPISCFDERLQEDPRVCRLEDALIHWKAICSSILLSQTNLVLLLHNIDVLAHKIAAGVMVKDYIVSYGDRPNNIQSVLQYLRKAFNDTLKNNSPTPRISQTYFVSAINAQTIAIVMSSGIMRAQLRRANLLP